MNIRDLLNKIKWEKNIEKLEIWYLHRGALNNTKKIKGDKIINIRKSFFDTSTSSIPFHRILRIIYDEEVLFVRK